MSAPSSEPPPDGIDPAGVEGWFAQHVPGVRPPLRFDRVAGGRSNLTFHVTDSAGGEWALRRPPLHGGLASAHDMRREHRVIDALGPTAVPVPGAIGLCEDEHVNGEPFYVMQWVDGLVLRAADECASRFDEPGRRRIAEALVDALVEIHGVDVDAVGLGDLGRREGYIERQLRRWKGQWDQSTDRNLPLFDEVHRELSAQVPDQGAPTIVHGDYRLDNMLITPDGAVAAVLDWELCTLGDPLADVGLLSVYWQRPGGLSLHSLDSATMLDGFPEADELVARYAERSGRDVSRIDFYRAFGCWRLAAILEGVYARWSAGAYGQADEAIRTMADTVVKLLEAAREACRVSTR